MKKRTTSGKTSNAILSAGLEPYTGSWGRAEAAHLARRVLFGSTKADIETLSKLSMSQAVDKLLETPPSPPEPVAYIASGSVPQGMAWADSTYDAQRETQRFWFLQTWWINLGLNQTQSILEKMTLFWHNHFATSNNAVKDARYMYKQNVLIRDYALGNFKDLVREITYDPAMLRWLSGNSNTKSQPNENYGRELQELFSIGKGPERSPGDFTNYTEADVKAAARVLTGWSDVSASINAKFTSGSHDTGNKTFSAAYGNKVINGGSTESAARREIDDLLNMIFAQDAVAERIVRKMYLWFVDYQIDSNIETSIIKPLADLFRTSNYDIRPVISTLLKSAFFYDSSLRGALIKNPIDFVFGTIRNFRPAPFYQTALNLQFWGGRTLRRLLSSMQQEPLAPPNVAGWAAYYQAPFFHELWINTDSVQKRVKFINDLATDGMKIDEYQTLGYFDVIDAAKRTNNPSNADALIREWVEWSFPIPFPDETINKLKQVLLTGLPDYEWTVEWNDFIADEKNDTKKNAVQSKLQLLVKYMLNMAEYHLA